MQDLLTLDEFIEMTVDLSPEETVKVVATLSWKDQATLGAYLLYRKWDRGGARSSLLEDEPESVFSLGNYIERELKREL